MSIVINDAPEKTILVKVSPRNIEAEDMDELAALAHTAGAEVIHRTWQHLPHPHRNSYVGSGKLEELAALCAELSCDLVIFDDALSPTQLGTLNDALPCRVIDRNQLILDVFAQRALSREGRLQVELAQLTYLLPRLVGQGKVLSRLGGGIGTRGPGESKLETDRRHLRRRISALREEIDELRQQRLVQRQGRKRDSLPHAALVGYTNAGKSTLMNALTGSDLLAEDKLFATLDTTTRRLRLLDGRFALLSDTVGFMRNLPTNLIAAFRATLEELQEADLLLHVVDISRDDYQEQIAAVHVVLDELEIERSVLMVFNKNDILEGAAANLLQNDYPGSVVVSALTGDGLPTLLQRMQELLYAALTRYVVLIPYSESHLLEPIYAQGKVLHRFDGAEGTTLEIESETHLANRLNPYRLPEDALKWQPL